MPDNAPEASETGSELTPRDARYVIPQVRSPQSIDGEPHEALAAALEEAIFLLAGVAGYAEKLEALTRSTMLSEALDLPDDMLPAGGVEVYPEATLEYHLVVRANKHLAAAAMVIRRAMDELAKPVAESRRIL